MTGSPLNHSAILPTLPVPVDARSKVLFLFCGAALGRSDTEKKIPPTLTLQDSLFCVHTLFIYAFRTILTIKSNLFLNN